MAVLKFETEKYLHVQLDEFITDSRGCEDPEIGEEKSYILRRRVVYVWMGVRT